MIQGLRYRRSAAGQAFNTADWAETPAGRDFYRAMTRVEQEIQAAGATERAARFVSCLCLAWPDGHRETFMGRVEGALTWPPRGTMGFGFDPVFVPIGFEKTFAELDPVTKHAISHRADAFRQLVDACFSA